MCMRYIGLKEINGTIHKSVYNTSIHSVLVYSGHKLAGIPTEHVIENPLCPVKNSWNIPLLFKLQILNKTRF